MRGNEQVVHTDGLPDFFQSDTDGAIVLRGLGAAEAYFQATAEVLDGEQTLAPAAAFLGAVHKFDQGEEIATMLMLRFCVHLDSQ